MSNELMEGLSLGGFSYDLAFPFSKAEEMTSEKVLAKMEKVLNKEAFRVTSKVLGYKEYDSYLKAIGAAEKRFLFYKDLLESEELRNKHLAILGVEDLTLRTVFAMIGCVNHTNKILHHIGKIVERLASDCISAVNTGYRLWAILNQSEPVTECIMTGICICKQGEREPYIEGCVRSDPTKITISKEEREKRLIEHNKILVARIRKKNK